MPGESVQIYWAGGFEASCSYISNSGYSTSLLPAFGELAVPDRWLSIGVNAALILLVLLLCRGEKTRRRTTVIRECM